MSDPKEIFLQPECCADLDTGRLWCEHDAPVGCEHGNLWTRYVLATVVKKQATKNAVLTGVACIRCMNIRGAQTPLICVKCCGSDISESEYKGYQAKRRRKENRERGRAILNEMMIPFETKDDGVHLLVSGPNGLIDFWPSTGLFKVRESQETGRGINKLVNYVKQVGS